MGERIIRVRGSAHMAGVPDWVVISFDARSHDYLYEKCMEQMGKNTENLRSELVSIGFEADNLKTSDFQINPDFEWVKNQRTFRGYRASHHLRIEFAFDKEFLNKVLHVLGKSESEASFQISFIIKDPEPLKQKALAEAVRNARSKAEVLAEASGVNLGEIQQIDYSWSEVHFDSSMKLSSMAEPEMMASYDITPDDIDVSDSVTVVWSIK